MLSRLFIIISITMINKELRYIKGVGPKRESMLNRLGIYSLMDLVYYFPVRYEDRTQLVSANQLKENEPALILVKCGGVRLQSGFYGRKSRVEAVFFDDTGKISVTWFNQPYVKDNFEVGKEYFLYGKPRLYKNQMQLVSPAFDVASEETEDSGKKILPIYRSTAGLKQSALRKIMHNALAEIPVDLNDPLSFAIKDKYNFPIKYKALMNIHFPETMEQIAFARSRFIFEEFFMMQLMVYRRKVEFRLSRRRGIKIDNEFIQKIKDNFGYELTKSQNKVLNSILEDIKSSHRSSRLLQGDVGSGKTIVALVAAFCVAKAGHQAAFMVPTEVLAQQHLKTIKTLASDLNINAVFLGAATKAVEKKEIYKGIKEGLIDIVVGTQALLTDVVEFKDLRFIVVDEQHRFGVCQRAILGHKGHKPDVLVMSATPIPRTLALTMYGDLDVSKITEYPKGRKFPSSAVVPEAYRERVYKVIENKINEGRQAYVIFALVEESEDEESDLKSAVAMHKQLVDKFKDRSVGLLHGKLKSGEKVATLNAFRKKEIDILVSTLVVEVGVDVPNATLMMVENPERFGLAQLHQLRGRIMRSSNESFFYMMLKKSASQKSKERLKVIEETCDGFQIAESDLKLRGPGDVFGITQSGYIENRIADVEKDFEMLKQARRAAHRVIEDDPTLSKEENLLLKKDLSGRIHEIS